MASHSTWDVDGSGESAWGDTDNASDIPGKEYYTFVIRYNGIYPLQYIPQHGIYDNKGKPVMSSYGTKTIKTEEGTQETVYQKKVERWTTKMDTLNGMDPASRAVCNSLKAFLTKSGVGVFYHNAAVDSCAKFGGPHLHVVVHSERSASGAWRSLYSHTNFRTLKKRVTEGGGYLRSQAVRNLDGLMYYLTQAPRVFMGTNDSSIYMSAKRVRSPTADTLLNLPPIQECLDADANEIDEISAEEVAWSGFDDIDGTSSTGPKRSGDGWDDEIDVPPPKQRKITVGESETDRLLRVVRAVALHYNAYTITDISRVAAKTATKDTEDEKKFQILWQRLSTKQPIKRWLDTARTQLETEQLEKPFAQLIDEYCSTVPDTPEGPSAEHSYSVMLEWCKDQSIDVFEFVERVFNVMDRKDKKINTIAMVGPSNAGKTIVFMEPICELARFVGKIGNRGANSEFVYMDLPNKRVVAIDECIMSRENLEDLKLLLGGQPLKVNVKNQGPVDVHKTPCLLAGNKPPWLLDHGQKEPLLNRMYYYNVKEIPALADIPGINPKMWWYLMQLRGMGTLPELGELVSLPTTQTPAPEIPLN